MKLSPLIVFLLLLLSLVISIIFQQWLSKYFTENVTKNKIGSISEYDFFKGWGNMEGYTDKVTTYSDIIKNGGSTMTTSSSSNSQPSQLNITPVYDISKALVNKPKKATLYYDSSGNLINFPKDIKVYDELGNNILAPTVLGFMTDEYGNPLDMNIYDANNKKIKDISKYLGPVYDSYHNLIYFPYIDSNGDYVASPVMTPEIFKSYLAFISGTNKNYTDISCAYGCVNFTKSLDDYISDYYQHFWNENKQVYSDDYVLKSSVVSHNDTYDVRHKWDSNDWNNSKGIIGSLGSGLQNVASTVGKDVQAVAGAVGSGAQNVASTVGKDVKEVGSEVYNATKTVGGDIKEVGGEVYNATKNVAGDIYGAISTIGNDGKEIVGAVGSGINSGLSINSTNINNVSGGNVKNGNNRGLAGNYNGDNSVTNRGYLNGTNQFSVSLPAGVANFNNNYNASPIKDVTSNFLPVTADFSKFGR